jgi:hypothetical protein
MPLQFGFQSSTSETRLLGRLLEDVLWYC